MSSLQATPCPTWELPTISPAPLSLASAVLVKYWAWGNFNCNYGGSVSPVLTYRNLSCTWFFFWSNSCQQQIFQCYVCATLPYTLDSNKVSLLFFSLNLFYVRSSVLFFEWPVKPKLTFKPVSTSLGLLARAQQLFFFPPSPTSDLSSSSVEFHWYSVSQSWRSTSSVSLQLKLAPAPERLLPLLDNAHPCLHRCLVSGIPALLVTAGGLGTMMSLSQFSLPLLPPYFSHVKVRRGLIWNNWSLFHWADMGCQTDRQTGRLKIKKRQWERPANPNERHPACDIFM